MEPKTPPPRTELPDLISSDSVPTLQRQAQQNTLPSAKLQQTPKVTEAESGGSGELVVIAPPPPGQITRPTGPGAQPFRPPPSMTALGGEILEWTPPQRIRARYPAHEGWTNNSGTLSPGFIVAMFDPIYSALAQGVAPSRQSAIIETSVRFFRSIRGGHVIVDGTVLRAGRTTATVECIAWDTSGELCAKGSSTLMLIG
jgi:uncharacterized protein (TIGR00369 family)